MAEVYKQTIVFLENYPDSKYFHEADKMRFDLLHLLARHELSTALHYAKLDNYEAANKHIRRQKTLYADAEVGDELANLSQYADKLSALD